MQNTTRKLPFSPPFFYGWVIVFIAGWGVFFSGPGQTYSVSAFINSFIADFGWSRSYVSGLYSGATLLAGILLSVNGRLIDRKGHRFMMPIIVFILGLACLWMSFIFHPFMLFLGFFMIRLFGQGSMTLVSSTLVPQWFISKRGKALSIMVFGGIAASALLPPLNTWLIETYSWPYAWRFWTILLWFFMIPLTVLTVRNRPEDVGLYPDGTSVSQNPGDTADNDSWPFQVARRTRAFKLLLFCSFVPAMVNTGLTFQHVSMMAERGIAPLAAASVLSIMAVVALPTNLLAGYMLDRFPSRLLLAITFLVQVVSMLWLLLIINLEMAVVYGILRGIAMGLEALCLNVIWPDYFGRSHLASIRGLSMTVMVIGTAWGPLPFGFYFDLAGNYNGIIVIMIFFSLLAALASYLARPPQRNHC